MHCGLFLVRSTLSISLVLVWNPSTMGIHDIDWVKRRSHNIANWLRLDVHDIWCRVSGLEVGRFWVRSPLDLWMHSNEKFHARIKELFRAFRFFNVCQIKTSPFYKPWKFNHLHKSNHKIIKSLSFMSCYPTENLDKNIVKVYYHSTEVLGSENRNWLYAILACYYQWFELLFHRSYILVE